MVASAVSTSLSLSSSFFNRTSASFLSQRNSAMSIVSALPGLSSRSNGLPLKIDEKEFGNTEQSYGAISAKKGNPPIMPAVMTPGGALDLSTVLFRNRIIFIGQASELTGCSNSYTSACDSGGY